MTSAHINIVIDEDSTFRTHAQAAGSREGSLPIGSIRFDDSFISVQSTSVTALLALADACQEAARRLRARQIADHNEAAVA